MTPLLDIAAYRLRAFEAGFIAPRLKTVRQSLDLEEHAIPWTTAAGRDSKLSHLIIQLCLLREAAEWVREGRRVGYFSSSIEPLPIVLEGKDIIQLDELKLFMKGQSENIANVATDPSEDSAASNFGTMLHDAIEDLTEDRIEFLRLVVLTDENEWHNSLEMLRLFNDDVESQLSRNGTKRDGARSVSLQVSSQVDALSWALSGPESNLAPSKMPSDWRSDAEIGAGMSAPRLSNLLEERARLRRLVETLATLEGQPALSAQSQQVSEEAGSPERSTYPLNDRPSGPTKKLRSSELGPRQELHDDPGVPDFRPGDTVEVYVRMAPQSNSRIKKFRGFVLERMGEGLRETFTVRKVSFGVGVERTFPINSEIIEKIEVVESRPNFLKAKYYLRQPLGRTSRSKQESANRIPPG